LDGSGTANGDPGAQAEQELHQPNGLKYQTPEGEVGRFQPKCLPAKYTTVEPTKVSVGFRTISHNTGAKVPNSRI
jgi:hypothetical protein